MTEKKRKYTVPAKMTALIAKTSEDHVLKVRAGKRQNGKVAKRVKQADEQIAAAIDNLIDNKDK